MTRYDFPNVRIAIMRAQSRAKRRGQDAFVYRTPADCYTISFTEPPFALRYYRVPPTGDAILVTRQNGHKMA